MLQGMRPLPFYTITESHAMSRAKKKAAESAPAGGDIAAYMQGLGRAARAAARRMAASGTEIRNRVLEIAAEHLEREREALLRVNAEDLEAAQNSGLDASLLERLALNSARVDGMIQGLREVAALPDPVGEITDLRSRPSGIRVGRMRVPLGVIGIIYESRPSVTADAAALCLKAGNAVILRGGSEAFGSNRAITACLSAALEDAGLPGAAVQTVETADRAAVGALLAMSEHVDMLVPRGGKSLVERVSQEARMPVLKHLDGVCHVYIDESADIESAIAIAINAKTHRYGVCNAMETLLVAESMARGILPPLAKAYREAGVELRGCEGTRKIVPEAVPAAEQDWREEYLAPILAVRIVADMEEAMEHIAAYGSGHTDCIVTSCHPRAMRFLREVDSSSVLVNASTRFADGFEYGLGAEIGISTDRLHARGPVGLEGLTTQKFVVLGEGQVRR